MKVNSARKIIFGIFLSSLVISLTLTFTFLTFLDDVLYFDEMLNIVEEIGTIYSLNFAVILPGVFTKTFDSGKTVSKLAFNSATILSLIWNIVIVGICISLWWLGSEGKMDLSDFFSFSNNYIKNFSFLITAGLAFFFINQQSTKE